MERLQVALADRSNVGSTAIARTSTGRGEIACDPDLRSNKLLVVGVLSGSAVGTATVLASLRWDVWALAPALSIWGAALVAAACCDAVTQRVPTPLVRQAGLVTLVLLTRGLALHRDWRGLLISIVAAVVAGATLLVCWRCAGAGFGEVRLATLGGLGLGHATPLGLVLSLVYTVISPCRRRSPPVEAGTAR